MNDGAWYECHWCDAPMQGVHRPIKPGAFNYHEAAAGRVAREVCWDCVQESNLWATTEQRRRQK